MRFWDASALVPLFLAEAETARLRELRREDPAQLVWWATRVECASALARAVREGRLTPTKVAQAHGDFHDLFAQVDIVEPSDPLRDRAERLVAVHPLRAADALQLAAALVWARERTAGLGFVCLDDRLHAAAGREGFTVLPLAGEPVPGAH